MAASRKTRLEKLRVLHLVLKANRRLVSRQLGEGPQNLPLQGHTSSNKAIPASKKPYLLIVPFPGPSIFKPPQVELQGTQESQDKEMAKLVKWILCRRVYLSSIPRIYF